MSVSKKIRRRVNAKNELELFSFNHMVRKNESHAAISKELSRLYSNGEIKRLRNGVYYKPKASRFGEIRPSEKDIVNHLLFKEGKRIGYVSGERSYNSLGLTSQISGVITIATIQEKRSGKFAGLRVRYVKAYGRLGKDDIYLMQILDAIKDIDKILDASVSDSLNSIYRMIKRLTPNKKKELVKIAQNYPPRVRAIIGAMMSNIWKYKKDNYSLIDSLKSGIINTSRFDYPNINNIISNAKSWNINGVASA